MADLIDRRAAYEVLSDYYHHRTERQHEALREALGSVPSAQPEREIVRCADCKYFVLNSWENLGGVPIIVAHEICTKWGDGCKTSEDGYCFMAKRRTDE